MSSRARWRGLRRLVKEPIWLGPGGDLDGIRFGKRALMGGGTLYLPHKDGVKNQIHADITLTETHLLDAYGDAYASAARALFNSPPFAVALAPNQNRPTERLGLLAGVLSPFGEVLDSGHFLSAPRLAGIIVITSSHDGDPLRPISATARFQWFLQARDFAINLAQHESRFINAPQPRLRATIVVPNIGDYPSKDLQHIQSVLRTFDYDVKDVFDLHAGRTFEKVTRETAPLTVLIGPQTIATLGPRLRDLSAKRVDINQAKEHDWVDHLCLQSNISPALLPLGTSPNSAPAKLKLPVKNPGRCLHDTNHRSYVEDEATQLWWTHDTSNHSHDPEHEPVAFKTYTRGVGTDRHPKLIHEFDRNAQGEPIFDKHKGVGEEKGEIIDIHNLNPCGTGPHL